MNRTLAACLALATVAALTACDEKSTASQSQSPTAGTSSPTATVTPTSTPSVSSTIAPPPVPPAATQGLTVTAAESFARFYLEASDYLVATGDAKLVRLWADKSCIACRNFANQYEAMYRVGGSVTGDTRTKVLQVTQVRLIRKDTAAVLIRAREGRQIERGSPSASPTTYAGDTFTWDLTLAAAGNHWVMFEMEIK